MQSKGFGPQLWRYAWDGEDQLRRVTTPDGVIWAYSYAPFRRWIGKRCVKGSLTKSPQRVEYLWAGNLLSEERRVYADGREQTVGYHYEQGSFRPLAQEVDGALQYIVTDYLGTPKELLSEDGEVVWSARHEVWGRPAQLWHFRAANDNAGYTDCLLRFQGQIEDPETGLYYNRFRYYDPQTGSYCSSDPIGLSGGARSHGYVASPTVFLNPYGLANYVYRALTEVQEYQAATNTTIMPKAPGANYSIQQHVENGRLHAQYLFTTKSPERALFYAASARKDGAFNDASIVKIDLDKINPESVLDISDGAGLSDTSVGGRQRNGRLKIVKH